MTGGAILGIPIYSLLLTYKILSLKIKVVMVKGTVEDFGRK
jgi:hypothetical protein